MNVSGLNAPGRTMEQKSKEVTPARSGQKEDKTALSMDDFFKLIAVQLQNQDMTNPMSNSEMMDQLVQMATVEAMASMTTQVGNGYATGLLGQQVDILYPDGKNMVHDSGVVTGVNMSTYPITVYLDDKKEGYPMSSIAFIGQNKMDDGEGPGDAEKPGDKPGETPGDKPGETQRPGETGKIPGEAGRLPGETGKIPGPQGGGATDALSGPGVKKAFRNNGL